MSWVTAAWSAVIAACLTLALPNVLVWLKDRTARAHLVFATASVATAAVGVCELLTMRADTPERYGLVLRWAHVPFLVAFASLVVFVRLYLEAGRPWLAWAAIGTRSFATLILNFLSPVNISYTQITRLRPYPLLGETVSVPEGIENPWVRIGELSSVLLLAYFVDATVTVWRRGDRRRALTVGGSMVLFIVLVATHAGLLHAGRVYSPYIVSFSFLGVMLAMGYELSADLLRARDLARRLQASEADVRESEQRMGLAVKAAELGMWVRDIPRDDVWMTEETRALWGFGAAEPITFDRFLGSLHPDDREAIRESVAKSVREDDEFEREYRILRPDGEVRWVTARGTVERDAAGAPVRMRGVSLDITRRKSAEMEVQRQRNELAHLSRVTMLGELSGSLAHELNQPLTSILSNAQAAQRLLGREAADLGEVREILKDIVDEDKRAGEVIQRLRLLLMKGEVSRQALDLSEVARDVLKIVRSDLVNQGVAVGIELAPDLPAVNGDRVQMQQVLLNLVVNGCDAMTGVPAAERRLLVRTEPNGGGVHVSVTDRGAGILRESVDEIFEPFVTTKPNGMGLGLTVCRTIVTAHGGTLWATNNPDRGATVHFTLPAASGRA
jgi:PAS domain S-box-containing protein